MSGVRWRTALAGAATTATFVALLLLTAQHGWSVSLPGAVGTAAVVLLLLSGPAGPSSATGAMSRGSTGRLGSQDVRVTRYPSDTLLAGCLGIAGAVSLTATTLVLANAQHELDDAGNWVLVEVGALLLLIAAGTRWAHGPAPILATVLTFVANSTLILRYVPDRTPGGMVAAVAMWGLGSAMAVFVGGYPRRADVRRRRDIAAARAAQRRQLERDLHDYVAHDLSGILTQAQAARFTAADDPETMRGLLAAIEGAATNALTSMDRSLELLRDDPAGAGLPLEPPRRHPVLADLPRAVEAFAAGSSAKVTASFASGMNTVPLEASTVLYRAVIEGLTNVRRHAPGADRIDVGVRVNGGRVIATVRNCEEPPVGHDEKAGAPRAESGLQPGRHSGTGLTDVRARLAELGGTLHAGAFPGGWTMTATVPLDHASRGPAEPAPGGVPGGLDG